VSEIANKFLMAFLVALVASSAGAETITGKVVGVSDGVQHGARMSQDAGAGLAQVSLGMAWWCRHYAREQSTEDAGAYEFAEQEARSRSVGLWLDPNPIPPWDWRHTSRR